MSVREILKYEIGQEINNFLGKRTYKNDTFTVELSYTKIDELAERLYKLLFCDWEEDLLKGICEKFKKKEKKT